jgi:hypothetical protein
MEKWLMERWLMERCQNGSMEKSANELSAISYQPSAISYQLSVISYLFISHFFSPLDNELSRIYYVRIVTYPSHSRSGTGDGQKNFPDFHGEQPFGIRPKKDGADSGGWWA